MPQQERTINVRTPSLYHEALRVSHGQAEADWLRRQVVGFWDDAGNSFDGVDNVRIACVDDHDEYVAYEDAISDGCCGSNDMEFGPSPAGRTYRYGFNFGH